jgi:hypothetical protein
VDELGVGSSNDWSDSVMRERERKRKRERLSKAQTIPEQDHSAGEKRRPLPPKAI